MSIFFGIWNFGIICAKHYSPNLSDISRSNFVSGFQPPILIARRLNTITETGNIFETVIAVTGRVLDLSDIIVVL